MEERQPIKSKLIRNLGTAHDQHWNADELNEISDRVDAMYPSIPGWVREVDRRGTIFSNVTVSYTTVVGDHTIFVMAGLSFPDATMNQATERFSGYVATRDSVDGRLYTENADYLKGVSRHALLIPALSKLLTGKGITVDVSVFRNIGLTSQGFRQSHAPRRVHKITL